MGSPDLYAILGVPPTADPAAIKRAYHFLAKAFHPDRFSDPVLKARAVDQFKAVQEAYEVLSDAIGVGPTTSSFEPASSRRPPIRSTGSSKRSPCSWWGASPASAPRCPTASVRSSGASGGRRPRNLNGDGGGSDDIVQWGSEAVTPTYPPPVATSQPFWLPLAGFPRDKRTPMR